MAIQISFETPDGVVHPEAYARIGKTVIENPAGAPKNVSIEVVIHASKAKKQAGKAPIWGPQAYRVDQPAAVQPDPPPETPVKECAVNPDICRLSDLYTWLKLQAAFMGGADV